MAEEGKGEGFRVGKEDLVYNSSSKWIILIIGMAMLKLIILAAVTALSLQVPTSCNATHPYTLPTNSSCYLRTPHPTQSVPGCHPLTTSPTPPPSPASPPAPRPPSASLATRPASPPVPPPPMQLSMTTPIADASRSAPPTSTPLPTSPVSQVPPPSLSLSFRQLRRPISADLRDGLPRRQLLLSRNYPALRYRLPRQLLRLSPRPQVLHWWFLSHFPRPILRR